MFTPKFLERLLFAQSIFEIQISIEDNTIIAPVAWIISGEKQENIIGRQVVFDAWDIEFRQADEQISFRFRGQPKFTDI